MWTEVLQEETKEHFKNMSFAAMKQFGTDTFGIGVFRDGKYIITNRESKEQYIYESMDDLIKAKWAID
ncbi:MAG: hypothetical protein COA44_13260 [Arcobacter sp.]|nr:MAG: hypothetical protein COA44_13260 [Arcobacter sp.]